jgi:hypothetical protein
MKRDQPDGADLRLPVKNSSTSGHRWQVVAVVLVHEVLGDLPYVSARATAVFQLVGFEAGGG